jgi:hypothetical protein
MRDRLRGPRGAVFPSPVVILSVLAVVMAGIAYVATRGGDSDEPAYVPVVQKTEPSNSLSPTGEPTGATGSADATDPAESPEATGSPEPTDTATPEPEVQRDKVYVEVYNNTDITGLAGRVADLATEVGWAVMGADNWSGTIPENTVYYPPKLKRAAEVLARDLGIDRLMPAVAPMRFDRLTVILTGPL